MLSIRRGLALILAASLAILAGCGNGTGSTGAVKISFWHGMNPETAHGKVLQNLVKEFNESQSEVVVEELYQGSYGDLEKKVTAALASKTGPIVVQNTDSMLTNLVRAKQVRDLSRLVPASDKSDYPEAMLTPLTYDQRLYGLPFNKSMIVLVYDQAVIANPPKTWEEFRQVAKEVTTKDRFGTAFDANVYYWGQHFVQAGGEWLTDGTAAFNSEAGVKALELIADMHKNGSAVQLKPREYASNYFNEGRAAMIATTSASFAFINPVEGVKWTAAPLYAGPKNDKVPFSGANLSITTGASNEETKAAMKFLLYMTGKEGSLTWATGKTGYMPVRKSALDTDTWKEFANANPEYAILGASMEKGHTQPNHPQWQNVQNAITEAIEKVLLGQSTPKVALEEAVTKANDLLSK
jgi:multiple sugar transport system substrate-binding protein